MTSYNEKSMVQTSLSLEDISGLLASLGKSLSSV